MADDKPQLARDGTMEVTAKEGKGFLDRNLTEWKKPYLTGHLDKEEEEKEDSDKPKLSKHTTMKETAKEAEQILDSAGGKPDADALTRGQQKKIEEIEKEPAVKKPRLSKDNTMVETAKEGKALLGKQKLGDTRQETAKVASKPSPKRGSTMAKTVEEAQELLKGVDESRRTRSQSRTSPPKPGMKRAGTMQATAKEGKEYLSRSKKDEGEEEENNADEKEEEDNGKAEEEEAVSGTAAE